MRHVLLVLHVLVEALPLQLVALARYPMQVQLRVYMMEQLSALLERSSIQSQQQPSLIALTVPQVMFARVDLLHLHPAQPVSI